MKKMNEPFSIIALLVFASCLLALTSLLRAHGDVHDEISDTSELPLSFVVGGFGGLYDINENLVNASTHMLI